MKGQVAFIAIIGVLVLIAAVGSVLIFTWEPETAEPPKNEERFSIEQCATATFEDSISLVSLYGGWYDPSFDDLESFSMGQRSFALWSEQAHIPSTNQLEAEIGEALEDRLSVCTEGLEGPGTITVDVQLGASNSRAAIEIDGWFAGTSSDERVSPFVVESDLPVLRAHSVAEDFTLELWDEEVLTDLNFNLIALNPDVPLDGADFSCQPKRWSVDDVRSEFFSGVQDVAPHISFDGTSRVSDPAVGPKVTFDLDSVPADASLSSYYFTDFGGQLEVDQSSGDQMTSFVTRSPDGTLCQNTYQFWYSMRYPIVFTLDLPSGRDGFLYRFAVPVSVSRNVEDENVPEADGFCSDVTPRSFSLSTIDARTQQPIDDVRATFVCSSNRCPLASVSGGIEDHLPSRCLSATILLDRDGYERVELDYRYDDAISGSTIELEPLQKITINTECAAEPCSFDGLFYGRVDTRTYPLSIGENLVPNGDLELLILEDTSSGPIIVYELEPAAGNDDGLVIRVDTDRYEAQMDGGGFTIPQVFPSGISSGEYTGGS